MLKRALIVIVIAALSDCAHAWQAASTQPSSNPSPLGNKSAIELMHAIRDWDGSYWAEESKRTPEQSAKLAALEELERRLVRKRIVGEELDAVLAQCYRGDASAAPMSKPWSAKYGWLLEKYWNSYPEVRPIEEKAYDIPFEVSLRPADMIRDGDKEWPALVEAPILMRCYTAWRPSLGRKVRAIADLPTAIPTWGLSEGLSGTDTYVVIPPLEVGQHEVSIAVEIYGSNADGTDRLLQSRRCTLTLRVVDPEVKLVALKSDSVANAIEKKFRPVLFQGVQVPGPGPEKTSTYFLILDMDDVISKELRERDSVGLVMELLDSESEVRLRAFYGRYRETSRLWDDSNLKLTGAQASGPWTLRVRASPALSLAAYRQHLAIHPSEDAFDGVVRYWSGELTRPVRIEKEEE